jgi:flagellar protein FlaJ
MSLGILVLLDTIAAPFSQLNWKITDERHPTSEISERAEDDSMFTQYARRKKQKDVVERLRNPMVLLNHYPSLTFVVTVPLAGLFIGGLSMAGVLDLSYQGMLSTPIRTTTVAFILPFYVVSLPFLVLFERSRRRRRRIEKRFPDVLSMISNANEIGMTLAESFSLVADRDHSAIAPELRRVHSDIEWNGDIGTAMVGLANRLRVPTVSRTMRLLIEANRSTSNLHRILGVAAEDANSQEQLKQERQSEVSAYTAVVIITFFVFLGIIAMLDVFFLDTFAAQSTPEMGTMGTPSSFNGLAIDEFRMAFFHASLVQALFGGLLAGKMAHNQTAVGLKYSVALITLALLVFLVL